MSCLIFVTSPQVSVLVVEDDPGITLLRLDGHTNIAEVNRHYSRDPNAH